MAYLLVRDGIATVGRIVTYPVRRLNVVGVGRHGLDDPVVSICGLPARVVEVIKQREALHKCVGVRGDGAEGCVVPEDSQGRVAVAAGYVAQDLIVGAVFTDDHKDVLDLGRSADPLRDRERRGSRLATGGREDVLRQIPVVVLKHLLRQHAQVAGRRNRDDAYGAKVLVRVEVSHAMGGSVGVLRGLRRWRRHRKARGADALVVCHQQRAIRSVQHNRARGVAYGDHAQHGT